MTHERLDPLLHPRGHGHAVDLDLTLDFLNTLRYDDGVPTDGLADVPAAVAHLAGQGIAHGDALEGEAALDPVGWLDRIRAFRAALREVFDAEVEGRAPGRAALDLVNAALRERPLVELQAGVGGIGVGHRHRGDATGEALARLAEPFVAEIAGGRAERFRICANDGCRWVFRDTSRAGRRRWCDMSSCGNRAKVARYRSRHKG